MEQKPLSDKKGSKIMRDAGVYEQSDDDKESNGNDQPNGMLLGEEENSMSNQRNGENIDTRDGIGSSCVKPADDPNSPPESQLNIESVEKELEFKFIIEKENKRALPKNAPTYELEKFKKKTLLIFNQVWIDGYYNPRRGTEKDVASLKATFELRFGFEVIIYSELKKEEIFRVLDEFTAQDLSDQGCIAIAVLTHGTYNGSLRAKDDLYNELDILARFKCQDKPSLITKPIILIIQACRGANSTKGSLVRPSSTLRADQDEETAYYNLPIEADTLILHSSYPGKPSYREEEYGSWFIQNLCKQINFLAHSIDLESIMVEVKRNVAIESNYEVYNKGTGETDVNKQMPVMTSTLIRKLYLKPFEGEAEDLNLPYCTTAYDVLDSAGVIEKQSSCSCYLDHFVYLRNCFRHYVKSAKDPAGKRILKIANHIDNSNSELVKQTLSSISEHLKDNSKQFNYYEFLYLYRAQKDGNNRVFVENNADKEKTSQVWENLTQTALISVGVSVFSIAVYHWLK